ncbi:NAD(P)/FAD-dependent oxidoreductase [Candidatus Aerophobetes bacterium]|nr:NAD(P)/FAD-dependent oxidoreductase [Candidatus Aerophobetes bacterium]
MRIVIIGAGPIGCYLGQLLKQYGFSPLILEEHPEIGIPKHCAGLVGNTFFKNSRIPLPRDLIKNKINGAIISYQNESFPLIRENAAFVIDREKLDKKLCEGLEIKKETKLLSLEKKDKNYLLYTNKGTFSCDVVIGADGATSMVRKKSGLKIKPVFYKGVQFRIKQKVTPVDMVQVHFTRPFLHFCWIIPEDEKVIRAGSISPEPLRTLESFMQKMKIKNGIIEKMGGVISIGYGETYKDGLILVGDAACQVKPLSGGGLYYGMRCAETLADCIKEEKISSYDSKWKKQIGKEIRSSLKIRNFLEKRDISFLEMLFNLAKKNHHLIEKIADFERHSFSVFSLARAIGKGIPKILFR